MQIEISLQSDNYNSMVVRENGRIIAFVRGRLHDLVRLLKDRCVNGVVVVRGNIKEVLGKISSDIEVRLIPLDLNINEIEVRAKLSEIDMKTMENGYIVYAGRYVFRSSIAKLTISQ